MQGLKPFRSYRYIENRNSGDVASGSVETSNDAGFNGIRAHNKNDRNCLGHLLERKGSHRAAANHRYDVNAPTDQLSSKAPEPINVVISPAEVDQNVLAYNIASGRQPLLKGDHTVAGRF